MFYYGGQWNTLALLNDTIEIAQHIHDTAIGGTGLIVYIIYKVLQNPDGAKNIVMMATPQGRAVSGASSILGGLKK